MEKEMAAHSSIFAWRIPGTEELNGLPSMGSHSRTQLMLVVYAYVYTHMQMVKCLPAMRKTWVRSLGREDPVEKEMATQSSTLAWKIP